MYLSLLGQIRRAESAILLMILMDAFCNVGDDDGQEPGAGAGHVGMAKGSWRCWITQFPSGKAV